MIPHKLLSGVDIWERKGNVAKPAQPYVVVIRVIVGICDIAYFVKEVARVERKDRGEVNVGFGIGWSGSAEMIRDNIDH